MTLVVDRQLEYLFGGLTVALAASSGTAFVLSRRLAEGPLRDTVLNFNARVSGWWWMAAIFVFATLIGSVGSVVLFGVLSFLAFREYITSTQTRLGDHSTLFWCFFVIIPLQYLLVGIEWYGLFTLLIPVYAFLLVPVRSAIAGDTKQFLERVAKIQWGLMLFVYCVSHAPALLMLRIPGFEGQNAKLLLFLVVVDELSDVVQYLWSRQFGRHPIAPTVNKEMTWEGTIAGICVGTLAGAALWWATPFALWHAGLMAFAITFMSFAGALTMGAIRLDRGILSSSAILDRIDSVCFTAPIFFHLTRHFFTIASH